MDSQTAQTNMVKQQIRTWNVNQPSVINAFLHIDRQAFVPQNQHRFAYADMAIPLMHGQSMLPPKVEAKMLQALDVQPEHHILEIGTGSGFFTALLAKLGRHVYSVDLYDDFMIGASEALFRQGINNITLETGNAATGWGNHEPYDIIAITGSMPILHDNFKSLLKPGGRLIAILGDTPNMQVTLVTRIGNSDWQCQTLFETFCAPLLNVAEPERFRF